MCSECVPNVFHMFQMCSTCSKGRPGWLPPPCLWSPHRSVPGPPSPYSYLTYLHSHVLAPAVRAASFLWDASSSALVSRLTRAARPPQRYIGCSVPNSRRPLGVPLAHGPGSLSLLCQYRVPWPLRRWGPFSVVARQSALLGCLDDSVLTALSSRSSLLAARWRTDVPASCQALGTHH